MEKFTRFVINKNSKEYPYVLLELDEIKGAGAPVQLYALGDPSILSNPSISIVGVRKASPYGLASAKMVSEVAISMGLLVVSGGAIGCDSAALHQAISKKAKTIVVLGSGADVVYPSQNRELYENVLDLGGVIISEQRWGYPPKRWTFPKRNRIIAALSEALVVTEAGYKSGTNITANFAMDLGREVLAVPGSIFSPVCAGSNRLISEHGATGIWSREDLESAIFRIYATTLLPQKTNSERLGIEDPILQYLLTQAYKPETLAAHLSCEPLEVIRVLSMYESKGLVIKQRDGKYAPSEKLLLESRHNDL